MNPLLAVTFETLPEVFNNSSRVSIPLGENERADKIHKDSPIEVCGKTMCANLVELPMNDFNIIQGMEWLHKCNAFMDCRSKVLRFCSHTEVELIWKGYNSSRSSPLILNVKAN